MREYEFRGKILNTDVWVYGNLRIHLVDGDLTQTEKSYFIEYDYMDKIGKVFRDSYEVDPSTIGQFTGLKDYDGNKIYEQDIVECGYESNLTKGVVKFGSFSHSKCSEYRCEHYGYYIEVEEFDCKLDLEYITEYSSIRIIKQ